MSNLTIDKVWFPIVTACLETYFTSRKIIYVVIDRTNWFCINLFMLSVVWEKRAFPIYFELLRHYQRRCTGRKVAPSSVVIRGSVQLGCAIATTLRPFEAEDLAQGAC